MRVLFFFFLRLLGVLLVSGVVFLCCDLFFCCMLGCCWFDLILRELDLLMCIFFWLGMGLLVFFNCFIFKWVGLEEDVVFEMILVWFLVWLVSFREDCVLVWLDFLLSMIMCGLLLLLWVCFFVLLVMWIWVRFFVVMDLGLVVVVVGMGFVVCGVLEGFFFCCVWKFVGWMNCCVIWVGVLFFRCCRIWFCMWMVFFMCVLFWYVSLNCLSVGSNLFFVYSR